MAQHIDARPFVVDLRDPRAVDPSLVGAKAANLALGAGAGLPVLPGLVVTTAATRRWEAGDPVPEAVADELEAAIVGAGEAWSRPLVVRSSSTVEDATHSSMAGRFHSELDVVGRAGIAAALRAVRDSAEHVAADDGVVGPIAVLLQPQLEARHGGVLFGVDPVLGDRRHLVVEAAEGNPSDLVSGRASPVHLVLSRRGRRLSSDGGAAGTPGVGVWLGRGERRALARLAAGAASVFGQPQDVEWAVDVDERLWLLQSRPVTAVAERSAGPLLGPGPVAETFPEPLRRLESDMWLAPLRDGIAQALQVTGAASARRVAASPVAVDVHGWAAVDLELLGVRCRRSRFGPLAGARRLIAAWRVGRLRAALPGLADDLVDSIDDHLADVPPLDRLAAAEIVTLLANCRDELVSVHGYEVLAGMLLDGTDSGVTAPSLALSALARGRARGEADGAVLAAEPIVLGLTGPRYGGTDVLPDVPHAPVVASRARLGVRDRLRARCRWLQELSGRAAAELGDRLESSGRLSRADLVRELDLSELATVVAGAPVPADLDARARRRAGAPLPGEFRLTASGGVIAARPEAAVPDGGAGASSGRAVGRSCHRWSSGSCTDAILVVATLDPGLSAVLPSLARLVSETGSALSHLAILAREVGVPTVVGVADARRRFPPGTRLLVDGRTGEVRRLDHLDDADHPDLTDSTDRTEAQR